MSTNDPNDPIIEGLIDDLSVNPASSGEEPPADPDPTPEIPPPDEEEGGSEPQPPADPDPTPEIPDQDEDDEEEEFPSGCHLVTERNCPAPELELERGCHAENPCLTLAHVTGIATACPLIEGDAGDAFSAQLEASGGDGNYTFTLDSSDIEDLQISEDGLITGALPLEDGTYRYTFTVTDGLGQTASATCTVVITEEVVEPPEEIEPPESACGRLEGDLAFFWSHNSRVGPFFNQNLGEIFFIGRDPNDANRLILVKTEDYGETWAIADDTFVSHTNDLCGFDCHQLQEDHALYSSLRDFVFVSMIERNTGRLSYGKVDLATSTWSFTDKQLVATLDISTDAGSGFTGITVTSTGDIGILYTTNRETVSGTARTRLGYRYSSDDGDTWSSELAIGNSGVAISYHCGRPVSDNAGRVQAFFGDAASPWGHYRAQTIRADHTLSAETMWRGGSGLSQIQNGRMGDYCTFESGGVTQIVFVCRMLEFARYTIFESSDNMIAPYQPPDVRDGTIGTTFSGLGGGTYQANYPQVSARMIVDRLHFCASRFDNSVPTWFYTKHVDSPYAPAGLTPTGSADQSGPRFELSGSGIPGQEMAAIVKRYEGEDYHVSLRDSGTAGIGLIFNWIRLDQLPTDSGYTIDDWAADCE